MSELSPEELIYGFERVFETSLKSVFDTAQIKCFTTQDTFDFQKDRPRVEVMFTPGAGQKQRPYLPAIQEEREVAFKGQYRLDLITAAAVAVHNDFRTKIRSLVHGLPARINSVEPMQYHKLQFINDAGTTPTLKPEDGYYLTVMIYDVDFSIQADAWALLATN